MVTTVANNQLLDFDDLFSSTFDLTHHDTMLMREEHQETSFTNNQPGESLLPNLICGVCGAPAFGHNFDQITCESCKAFFRRNALRHRPHLRCRFSGSCVINIQTRRDCTYCRLKKCFDIQMRKDWIRTEEEVALRDLQKLAKEQKQLHKTNDQLSLINLSLVARKKKPRTQSCIVKPISTQRLFGFHRNLSSEDRILLNNITNAYQIVIDQTDRFRPKRFTPSQSLIQSINNKTMMHQSLINFYKSIPEFNQLDLEDRVLLIKFNLVKIIHLHFVLRFKFKKPPSIGLPGSGWINENFHQRIIRARRHFDRFIEHPLILKLALVVFIFSINLSVPYSIDLNNDYINKVKIRGIQEFYAIILWRYLNTLFGEREAVRAMATITTQILYHQTLMNILEEYIRQEQDYCTFNPLESSLFRLT